MLPNLIEITPLSSLPRAAVTVPGSKSITNRALVLAALAKGETRLRGALWSEDTQVMVNCLRSLGFSIQIEIDLAEPGNRTLTVQGGGGHIPNGGTQETPLELFVGNAGTAARFLAALVCLGHGTYRLSGVPRMHERPQKALFEALQELGYRIDHTNGFLPAIIHGEGARLGTCSVSIEKSSQFASALELCADHGNWTVHIQGRHGENAPYVQMTRSMAAGFPTNGGDYDIEPDASGGSYFWGMNQLGLPGSIHSQDPQVIVNAWPQSGWQIDADYPKYLQLPEQLSRKSDLGDSIMTAITLAPLAPNPVQFNDLGRLRVQECERVEALRTELSKCGAKIREEGDSLFIIPSALHGAEIETYEDHRMAMCFSILGLKIPGIKIKNPACVRKTFPNFFQKLGQPSPDGLGATILSPQGSQLSGRDLHAG